MKNIFYVLALLIFFINNIKGQNTNPLQKNFNHEFCGTDFFHNKKMNEDPAYKSNYLKSKENLKKISSQSYKKSSTGITQIPVVVHVMHKGESVGSGTNISDEDVKLGIQYLNNFWRKVNNTEGFGDGVDMKIEFALAVQDPSGNCSTGIDRVNMSGVPAYVSDGVNRNGTAGISDYDALGGINSLKEYSIWDPTKYYNVWIVDEIDNKNCFSNSSYTAGYAFYASSHGQPFDGSVVLICSFLEESDTTWAHEMGHAFDLPHTFDGDDTNDDGIVDACGDDGIVDTPKHKRTSSISPSIYFDCANSSTNDCDASFNKIINPDTGFVRNSGTHQDHMHNYMDYTGCPTEFTGGQRAVAANALSTDRASFLTSPALTPATLATVNFYTPVTSVCLGDSIQFTDDSFCTPNTYTNSTYPTVSFLWTFNNKVNPPVTSTLQNPNITFANPGLYDVTLAITNSLGTTTLTKQGNISVFSGLIASCAVSSTNKNANFGIGATRVSLNGIDNFTSTFIPASATNDFSCSNNTTLYTGNSYPLNVNFKSRSGANAFLEVWIDWDNNGTFENLNTLGHNEMVLNKNIPSNTTGFATVNLVPPSNAVLNNLLRMRVITEHSKSPTVCGTGFMQRADDYGVFIKSCTPPTATITNNSNTTVLTCMAPTIKVTASGGVSYLWNNNMGIKPSISITDPGTYTVTVTSLDGCTNTESITITENKPTPTAEITNNTGSNAISCTVTSISVTATGGTSYSWDNGLGNSANATITKAGTYTVIVRDSNNCTDSKQIVIADEKTVPNCTVSSFNNNANYGCGVTKTIFNSINKTTSTFIPLNGFYDFVCSDITRLTPNTAYNLSVTYKSRNDSTQFLEVWIDWDNNGKFEISNTNGENERILTDNIPVGTTKTPTQSITAPVTAVKNTILRMRVISELNSAPTVCGRGHVKRADDYGVIVENTLGAENFSQSNFEIYPNPVKDLLSFKIGDKDILQAYSIIDGTGKIVLTGTKFENNTIPVSSLTNGIYILKIKTATSEYVSKFIKE